MNQEKEENLIEQLEQVTSRELTADVDLDADMTALRESWLAFTQLLDAADRDEEDHRVEGVSLTASSSGRRWSLAAMSVAAMLLVGVGLLWMFNRNLDVATRTPQGSTATHEVSQTEDTGILEDGVMNSNTDMNPDADDGQDELYDWNDSLDEEIALAEDALIYLRQSASTLEDRFDSLYNEIEQIEDEFAEETL